MKGMGMSKRDVSSDINLSPVQLINVALFDYMNNMGVVSFQIRIMKIKKSQESTQYVKKKLWTNSWHETPIQKINGTCPYLPSFQCCNEFFARLWNL